MKYKIIDLQLHDYLAPYDEDKDYWTLEEARDLAYRRQEQWRDEDDDEYYEQNTKYLNEIEQMTTFTEIEQALLDFEYKLEEAE